MIMIIIIIILIYSSNFVLIGARIVFPENTHSNMFLETATIVTCLEEVHDISSRDLQRI